MESTGETQDGVRNSHRVREPGTVGRVRPPLASPPFVLLIALALCTASSRAQAPVTPDTVIVHSGTATLRGLLYRPSGRGPFPAILINHGSGRTRTDLARLGPYEQQAATLGPVFARHGYVAFFLFRRGVGLSADQGENAIDTLTAAQDAHGVEARNALQIELLEGREMKDALAGLAALRARREVDAHRVALVGHSFGGSLTMLMAARVPHLRALVLFSPAGYSWQRSPELRARLLEAADHATAPAFFIHTANDFDTMPGVALDARLATLGKAHRVEIYPVFGKTPEEGHSFALNGVSEWEPDVFAFLDTYLKR